MDVQARPRWKIKKGMGMKKFVLTGFVALLIASPAMAADLRVRQPVYKAPPPPQPVQLK